MAQNRKRSMFLLLSGALCTALAIVVFLIKSDSYRILSVQSPSMGSAIRSGDLVITKSVTMDTLRVGDIISYRSAAAANSTVTHRVIGIDTGSSTLFTKGDAADQPDPPIRAQSVIGEVRWHVPNLGSVLDFIRSPTGVIALVYMPAAAIISNELIRLTRHYRPTPPTRKQKYVRRPRSSRTIRRAAI